MKTSEPKPEEILKKHCKNERGLWIGLTKGGTLKAMQEYAESYHNERLRKVATDIIITYHFTLPNNTVYLPENAEKAIKEYLKMKQ